MQGWLLATAQGPLGGGWLGYLEVQPRFGRDLSELDRLLLRPAVGFRAAPWLSLWQGYAWTPLFQPRYQGEHRPWQQATVSLRRGSLEVVNRTRLEERLIQRVQGASLRARHMLRLAFPIAGSTRWYGAAFDEAFFNLNAPDGGPRSGFDQNRAFVGIGRRLNARTSIEGGYMANIVRRPGSAMDRLNHVLLVWLNFSR